MSTKLLPSSLDISLLGTPIKIQRFARESWDSDTLVESSLVSTVGILKSYTDGTDETTIWIDGRHFPLVINHHETYFEIWVPEPDIRDYNGLPLGIHQTNNTPTNH